VLRAGAGCRGEGLLRVIAVATRPADLPAIRALLTASGLPSADLTPAHLGSFWIEQDEAGLVGMIGLELKGRTALLRSLAVRTDARGRGLGAALLEHAEAQARSAGVATLHLLTTTAEHFFAARGYSVAPRDTAPPEIQETAEFAGLCPSTSVCMRKHLSD
jgi:amino-acid N-acetyltransferase